MEKNIQEILNALTQEQVDNYETWLLVGMALHNEGFACSVWESWSRRSSKFKEGDCEARWRTFGKHAGKSVTLGTIIKMALDNGYKPSESLDWNDETGGRDKSHKPVQKPQNIELKEYLSALFKDGDIINYVVETYDKNGKWIPANKGANKTFAELIKGCNENTDISYIIGDWEEKAGAFVRINPMDGNGGANENVVEYRHALIESDSIPKEEQLRKLREFNLPCSAIVDSGGKSIHAIVKIDAGTDEKLYHERVAELHKFLAERGFPVDKMCKNSSRLSRLAGVTRNGIRQSLVAVNTGPKTYADWLKFRDIPQYIITPAGEIRALSPNDMSDNLLGNRFLCYVGSWLIIAQSGIGKSVLAMQLALHFAVGKEVLDVKPIKPLKVLFIQAENNSIDLTEPFHSITKKAGFTAEENTLIDQNLVFISEESSSGDKFIELFDDACSKVKPDLVIVDPLLSYIGGDISRQEVCSTFLRNKLNPLIRKHRVGVIIIHHTGKPPKDVKANAKGSSLSYLGIGSSELTNWGRAVSVLQENQDDNSVFEFVHTKRGHRSGASLITYIRHAKDGIFWERCAAPSKKVKTEKGDGASVRASKYDYMKFETLEPMSRKDLDQYIAKQLCSHGEPCDSKSVGTVVNRAKRDLIVFDEKTGMWQGRLYIHESSVNQGFEGGVL